MGILSSDNKECIFCNYKTQKVVEESEELVLFEDIKPMAKHHYLCIAKKHIKDINSLTKDDIIMLKNMKEMAIKYLTEIFKDEGVTKDILIFGFHFPPFTSIQHLHMHCVVPPYNNYYYVIKNDYLIMRDVDTIIKNLENNNN